MKEYGSEQGSSVQNRFTAYLVTAVKNKRISYMERKHQQTEFEAERPGVLERSYTDFEQEYRQYKLEHLPWKYNETPSIEQLIRVLEEGKLIESGTAEELQRKNGVFRKMWDAYQTSVQWKVSKEGQTL